MTEARQLILYGASDMGNTRSTKKNFLLTSFYQIVYVLTPIVTTPYISRVLGVDGIGDYSYAYSVAYYFVLFIRLGVLTYGNRTIASVRDDKEKLSKTFCEIYALQFITGVFFTGLYYLWTIHFAPRMDLSLLLITFVLSSVVDITWLLYGVEDFVITTIRDICIRCFVVLSVFAFVKTDEDVWLYALIQGGGYLAGQLIAWTRIRRYVYFLRPSRNMVLRHLKPDFVLFLPSIAVSLYKTLDKIMLGAMSSATELGYYESSERVISLPMALITALGTVMLPRMSNMIANDAEDDLIKRIIDNSLVFVTFISTVLCFGMMSVANMFVPLFYGDGYEKCVELYCWLLPSCVFLAFANVLRTQYLIPQKRDKHFVLSLFAGAVVNILFNVILIPHLESVGAAIATLLAEATVCIYQTCYLWKELSLGKSIIRAMPFIISGCFMYLFLGGRIVGDILIPSTISVFLSLGLKILECGMAYFIILGVLFGISFLLNKVIRIYRL
jgi:O-antigen/teichoic acid export membrane protein